MLALSLLVISAVDDDSADGPTRNSLGLVTEQGRQQDHPAAIAAID